MKAVLASLLLLLTCVSASAQIVGNLPYRFTNGTVIDAGQVNSNFSYLQNQVNGNAVATGVNSTITALLGLTTPLAAGSGGSSVYTAGTSTGSANAQVIATPTPSGFTLTGKPTIIFVAGYTNTGATQLNVSSTGLTNLYKPSQNGAVALTGGEVAAGTLIVATYDGTQFELVSNYAVFSALPGVIGFTQANDSVTPNSLMDLNASRVILANTSGGAVQFLSPSQCQINFATTGSYGGLDTGSVAPSTWYYTYFVSNGTSIGCFASLSATSPSISASYFFVRVGAVRTDGSSHLMAISQTAEVVTYTSQPTITANASAQAISPYFPPTAKQFVVNINSTATSSGLVKDNAGNKCGATSVSAAANDANQNVVCSNLGTNFIATSVNGANVFVAYGWRETAPVH
jgi:hypothetical protein